MQIKTDNLTALIFLVVLMFSIIVGACRCSMQIRSVKADDLPPLYLEYFLPAIYNNPLSIGEPPDPIE